MTIKQFQPQIIQKEIYKKTKQKIVNENYDHTLKTKASINSLYIYGIKYEINISKDVRINLLVFYSMTRLTVGLWNSD